LAARALSKPGESATERDRRIERADADAARIGTELAQHLLAPWAHDLPTKLFVVAEGALNYVPIAALPDPVDPKRAMVAAHEIIQLPTAALLIASAPDRQSATTNGISIWADPVFDKTDARALEFDRRADDPPPASNTSDLLRLADDPNIAALPRLRFSGHEAEAIASFADRVTTEMHRGFAAHRDALLEAAPKSSIVHIATHGLINDARPEQSGLVLSRLRDDGADRPGLVTLSDIYALDLRAELVVLSACETALGQELRGEGLVGLVHAFVSAGAERVLASLWKIHDRGTAELMHRFYRELLQRGLSPAQALAAAQRSMAADPRWQAPYYWAPFVLYGDEGP
jgi:CHAT domain-containing protein